jgi:integrase
MMAAMEKTRTPGIFKRGSRYVVVYYAAGKQRKESARTLDEARRLKSKREGEVSEGQFHEQSRITLHEYALEWVERYLGRGRGGFREGTRDEYRRQLNQYVLEHFPERTKLSEVTPSRVAVFVGWLCDEKSQGKTLSDSTVRNIMAPLRACLATAVREGIIRSNPARDVDLPHRPTAEESEEEVRALSREQLSTLLELFPDRWRLFFTFLATTGLRISEAIALEWRHLELDGSEPHVKVRRALVKGRMGPPKSRYGRREIPLEHSVVVALREHRKASDWPGDENLVFPAGNGSPLRPGNLNRRVLQPVREEADLSWVGFHTFRHTCATLLFNEGRNAVQVQRWLGHHSPSFTLNTYTHLLDGDLGAPLDLQGGNKVAIRPTPSDATTVEALEANFAQ